MASIYRSCFRPGNVLRFSKNDWLHFVRKNQEILHHRAVPPSMLYQNTSTHKMHSLASINSISTRMPLLGPSVRRLLDSYGLDRHLIKPSGHKGQLLKGDVLKYINEHAKEEIKFTEILQEEIPKKSLPIQESNIGYVDVSVSNAKREIARQLVESKTTTPHTYNTIDCHLDNLLAMRNKFHKYDRSVSVNDFVIKGAALTLRQVPGVNASWLDDGPIQLNAINIAIAVHTTMGVLAPVIKDADQLDIFDISKTALELTERALNGLLRPDELQNASFTISNLGSLGIKTSTAVIDAPQSAVLTMGDCQTHVDDDYKLSNIMNVTLCCDGRVIDEELASRWLTKFKDMIETPLLMGL